MWVNLLSSDLTGAILSNAVYAYRTKWIEGSNSKNKGQCCQRRLTDLPRMGKIACKLDSYFDQAALIEARKSSVVRRHRGSAHLVVSSYTDEFDHGSVTNKPTPKARKPPTNITRATRPRIKRSIL